MRKKSLKVLTSALLVSSMLMSQTAFAASGSSKTYSNHGDSTTYAENGGETLYVESTFYYRSNEWDKTYQSSSSSSGTGPSSMSTSAWKRHDICHPIKTLGYHEVHGWSENYTGTSSDIY